MNLNIFSDLRKPGLVPGKSLSPSTKFDSVLEKNKFYKNRFVLDLILNCTTSDSKDSYFCDFNDFILSFSL